MASLQQNSDRYFPNPRGSQQLQWVRYPFQAMSSDLGLSLPDTASKQWQQYAFRGKHNHTVLPCSSTAGCCSSAGSSAWLRKQECSDPVSHHIPMNQGFQLRHTEKNKYRNSLNAEHDLNVALSKTEPRIDMLVENFNQPHTSHKDCVCVFWSTSIRVIFLKHFLFKLNLFLTRQVS